MKKLFLLGILLFFSGCSLLSQKPPQSAELQKERNLWLSELRQYTIDLRYVYGKKTGWIDLSHAFPYHTNVKKWTAVNIWQQMKEEKGSSNPDFWNHFITRKICDPRFPNIHPDNYFAITYEQAMGVYGQNFAAIQQTYLIKKGLSNQQKEQVAYAIFMNVSYEFEYLQGDFPYAIGIGNSASSFSTEDLPSNAIGFFAVTRAGAQDKYNVWKYIKKNAELVSAKKAKKIQKKGFKQEKNKNVTPILYHKGKKQHLSIFDTPIKKEGQSFIDVRHLKRCQ